MSTPIAALNRATEPLPVLELTHKPGFMHELDTFCNILNLFDTTQEDYGLSFSCMMTWYNEGDPDPVLTFDMEPRYCYWHFEDADEPLALADKVPELAAWLRDVARVVDWARRSYPDVRVEGEPL